MLAFQIYLYSNFTNLLHCFFESKGMKLHSGIAGAQAPGNRSDLYSYF